MVSKVQSLWNQNKDWVVSVFIVIISTVGYDYFESSSLYNFVLDIKHLDSAIEMLYSEDPGLQNGLFLESATSSKELNVLSTLYTNSEEDDLIPYFIMRMAVKNAPYVQIPTVLDEVPRVMNGESKQIILGTEFSPALMGLCPTNQPWGITEENPVCKFQSIGNKYQIEQKIEERKKAIRSKFNIGIVILSIWAIKRSRSKASTPDLATSKT
jgi:hypothetical protein